MVVGLNAGAVDFPNLNNKFGRSPWVSPVARYSTYSPGKDVENPCSPPPLERRVRAAWRIEPFCFLDLYFYSILFLLFFRLGDGGDITAFGNTWPLLGSTKKTILQSNSKHGIAKWKRPLSATGLLVQAVKTEF